MPTVGRWTYNSLGMRVRYSVRLTALLALCSILPILILAAILFRESEEAMSGERERAAQRHIRQTSRTVELVVDTIESSVQQAILRGDFLDLIQFSEGARIEQAIRNRLPVNTSDITRYREALVKAFQVLDTLRISNPYVRSVYFFDRQKDLLLSGDWSQRSLDALKDSYVPRLLDAGENVPRGRWESVHDERAISESHATATGAQSSGTETGAWRNTPAILPYVQMTGRGNTGVIVEIDLRRLYDSVMTFPDSDDIVELLVVDAAGNPLIYDPRSDSVTRLQSRMESLFASAPSGTYTTEENSWILTWKESGRLGWRFVTLSDGRGIYDGLDVLRNVILTAAAVAAVVAAVLILVSGNKLYAPVRAILGEARRVGNLRISTDDGQPEPTDDEFMVVQNCFRSLQSREAELERELQGQLEAREDAIAWDLLTGRIEDEERLSEMCVAAHCPRMSLPMVVLVVVGSQQAVDEAQVRRAFDGATPVLLVAGRRGEVLAVASGWGPELDESVLTELQVSVGISAAVDRLPEVPDALDEARVAAYYARATSAAHTVSAREVHEATVVVPGYPKEMEEQLCGHIRLGEPEQAQEVFESMLTNLLRNRRVPFYEVEKIFFRLLNALIETAEEAGVPWETVFPHGFSEYHRLTRLKDVDEITAWYRNVVGRAAHALSEAYGGRTNANVAILIDQLEDPRQLASNLSEFADWLGVNASYLGRVFREQTGVRFVEYLTRKRVEHAAELLKTTNMAVKDIARTVGYANSVYFIRIFRQHVGTTPGEYRTTFASAHASRSTLSEK